MLKGSIPGGRKGLKDHKPTQVHMAIIVLAVAVITANRF